MNLIFDSEKTYPKNVSNSHTQAEGTILSYTISAIRSSTLPNLTMFSLTIATFLLLVHFVVALERVTPTEEATPPPSRAFCGDSSNCPDGEICDHLLFICVYGKEDPSQRQTLQTLQTLLFKQKNEDVCVDVAYLTALGHTTDQFVHTSPFLASTVCPGNGLPCGTANHMVRLNGENLSYKQLCERVVCTKKTTVVNSVFSHVWEERVHGDVALTMYDVRHPEMMQLMLHRVMHLVRKIVA